MDLELQCYLPGKNAVVAPLSQSTLVVGSLPSNQVILAADGVDPIHAILEHEADGWILTDLGSELGVYVNGSRIDVETKISIGDDIKIGAVTLRIAETKPAVEEPSPAIINLVQEPERAPIPPAAPEVPPPSVVPPPAPKAKAPPPPPPASPPVHSESARPQAKAPTPIAPPAAETPRPMGDPQPKPKGAPVPVADAKEAERRMRGDTLFSPRTATPAGDVLEVVAYWGNTILEVEHFHDSHDDHSYVTIGDDASNHFIGGGIEELKTHTLARVVDDGYALDLTNGMTARLRRGKKAENVGVGSFKLQKGDISHVRFGAIRYFFIFRKPPVIVMPKEGPQDPFLLGLLTFGLFVYLVLGTILYSIDYKELEKENEDIWSVVQLPEDPKEVPKPKEKPEVKVEEVVKPPPPREIPPPPPPAPVKPATPQEAPKPVEPKPVKAEPESKPIEHLAKPAPPAPVEAPPAPKAAEKAPPSPPAGNNQPSAPREGKQKTDVKGVVGVNNEKPSAPNLSSLGLGVGKISSKTGAGAINTKFVNSAGGAGGGAGSAPKTLGLGGVGTGNSLGLSGGLNTASQFGGGAGVVGGTGQLNKAFGGSRQGANVNVGAGDPLISGSISQEQIMAVIRANLNQIRNCYEKLLQTSPNAQGDMNVRFVVGAAGQVTSCVVQNTTIPDESLKTCVVSTIGRWKFPKPTGSDAVVITYPFKFSPL